jgi:uncharacterized protein (DUF1330 family)
MPAYIIVEVSVTDPKEYEEYKKLMPPSLAAYDGKFVVRGGHAETLEGGWKPERIAVMQFPSVERAKEWWSSEEYSKAKAIKFKAAKTKMIVVEGT